MITKFIVLLGLMLTLLGNNFFNSKSPITYAEPEYRGEKFPLKYLTPEDVIPTASDLNHYAKTLKRTVDYFSKSPNKTDCNIAVGLFYMKSLLKRTLQDDYDNIKNNNLVDDIKVLINKAENILSHYLYINLPYGWKDLEYRISKLFQFDESQVYSIGKFNRNRLKKWIYAAENINEFLMEIDDATLAKENFVVFASSMDKYFPLKASDLCISRIALNPEPVEVTELRPCRPDPECAEHIFASPSIAYALSHRFVNLMGLRHFRRCYLHSEKEEDAYMDLLCANMYRETVYLARRGYFARDLFMEHIALCSMLGYKEFHRRHWFHKCASWVDQNGCVREDRNFDINITKTVMDEKDPEQSSNLRRYLKRTLNKKCHDHPMALLMAVLAHGIRHAAHFMSKTIRS